VEFNIEQTSVHVYIHSQSRTNVESISLPIKCQYEYCDKYWYCM